MPAFRTRSGSRDGSTDHHPIRRAISSDQNEGSLKEPLLSMAESGDLKGAIKNRSPTTHRQLSPGAKIMTNLLDNPNALHLPSLPVSAINSNGSVNSNGHATSPTSSNNHNGNSNNNRWYSSLVASMKHNPDSVYIGIALAAWYLVGVLAICTTKLLLSTPVREGGVPYPLVLTLQQMFLGSLNLRTFLWCKGKLTGVGVQPWPVEQPKSVDNNSNNNSNNTKLKWLQSTLVLDFLLLAGLFNGLDFLASNTSFSHSSASFVETIKASEPITTTALAIWWGIDRLGKMETFSLTILITGVLISTYANATANSSTAAPTAADETPSLQESVKTCLTVMTANLCFAFRAMCQKLLRSTPSGSAQSLDDFNLLFRMQQTGAASLLLPVLLFQHHKLYLVLLGRENWTVMGHYVGLSLINAWAFATYSLASCFILSRISVVQHSGFGCLRRLFAIVATSIAFGVPIHALGGMGIFMSVVGFAGFTHYRFQRQGQGKKESKSSGRHNKDEDSDSGGVATIITKRTSSSDAMTAPLSNGSFCSSSDETP